MSSFLNGDFSARVPGAEHSGHFRTAITQTKTNIKNHEFFMEILWKFDENLIMGIL